MTVKGNCAEDPGFLITSIQSMLLQISFKCCGTKRDQAVQCSSVQNVDISNEKVADFLGILASEVRLQRMQ